MRSVRRFCRKKNISGDGIQIRVREIVIKKILIVIAVSLFFLTGNVSHETNESVEVVDQFKSYRLALTSDEINETQLLSFFSRNVLEGWLDAIISVDKEAWSHNVKAIKGELYVGSRINYVFDYAAQVLSKDRVSLTIVFKRTEDGPFSKVVLTYLSVDNGLVIDGIEWHFNEVEWEVNQIVDEF